MNRKFLFNIMFSVVGLIGLVDAIGCDRSNDVDERLNIAEEVMEERPDSALRVLNGIAGASLRGNRIKARYALLMSMAMDKNHIDTVTFDVLQPAIDYYINNGNSDERIRMYFYKGRIHRNAGDDDLAMQSYLTGLYNLDQISDSLTLARTLVAQSTLYYKQYQIDGFIANNLRAAEIYGRLGRQHQQLQSSLRALTGEVILSNKHRADSLLLVCKALANDSPSLKMKTLLPFLKCAVNFGTEDEVRTMIEEVENAYMEDCMDMTLARAYSKIGKPQIGLQHLQEARISPNNILDSLTYWSVKTELLENLGEEGQALDAFRNYSRVLEIYHDQLFSNELLFSEKKHELEMEKMAEIHKRDRTIKWILGGLVLLLILAVAVYYRYRINKAARLLAESNAEKLKLEGERQRLLAEKLESERVRLQLETENMHLQIGQLEEERERLKTLLDGQETLSEEARQLIRERIEILNGLIAQALTEQDSYGKEFKSYIAKIKKDKKGFQKSLVKLFEMTHPEFMEYLGKHGLTERELHYCCLYAIGLRGKEIGVYLDLVRHYNISTEVRRKLGLDPSDRNLGPFLQKKLRRR